MNDGKAASARLFVSIPVPENVGRTIKHRTAALRGTLRGASWEPPEKFHITLRFLGETRRPLIPDLLSALRTGCRGVPSFGLNGTGIEVLTRRRGAAVLMLAVEAGPALLALKQAVDDALEDAGVTRGGRNFVPHITVARCRRRLELPRLPRFEAAFAAERVLLMESELRREGSRHRAVGGIGLEPVRRA